MVTKTFTKFKSWYFANERLLAATALLVGFTLDWLTLQRIDTFLANIYLMGYVLIAASVILFINLYDARHDTTPRDGEGEPEITGETPRERAGAWLRLTSPLLLQFAFGGLFSVFVVFYTRSGSFSTSSLFVLVLVLLMIGNEAFRDYYERLSFQVCVLFFAIFSFAIFYVPILLGEIGVLVFVLSGLVSLLLVWLFILLLMMLVPGRFRESWQPTTAGVLAIFLTINCLYFLNVIPPIPLSLQAGEVVHQVERLDESRYLVTDTQTGSAGTRYDQLRAFFSPEEIYLSSGAPVYFFSSVFAPTDLDTEIVHHWQYYNASADGWQSISRISFPISGGRADGYRGFSFKRQYYPGRWRVDVETPDGRIIGRRGFQIRIVTGASQTPELSETVR